MEDNAAMDGFEEQLRWCIGIYPWFEVNEDTQMDRQTDYSSQWSAFQFL